MHVRLLTDVPDIKDLSGEWMDLYRTNGQSPFQNPELHWAWWHRRGHGQGYAPLVAAGRQNGRLVAIASFAIKRSRMLRILEWTASAAFDYQDVLLVDGIDAAPLWTAIRRSERYDIASLRWVRRDASGDNSRRGRAARWPAPRASVARRAPRARRRRR